MLAEVELDPIQPPKTYPTLGVAIISISVPSSYVPPSEDTVPPSAAETVKVYFTGIGSGV